MIYEVIHVASEGVFELFLTRPSGAPVLAAWQDPEIAQPVKIDL